MKIPKGLLFLLVLLSMNSCERDYGIIGPLEQVFTGMWKLKETESIDGKIDLAIHNQYFYNKQYGDVNIGKPTPLAKDSIVIYVERVPILATAIKTRIETSKKYRKEVALLDNGIYILMQNFTDKMMTFNLLEMRRANTLEGLANSKIERYEMINK